MGGNKGWLKQGDSAPEEMLLSGTSWQVMSSLTTVRTGLDGTMLPWLEAQRETGASLAGREESDLYPHLTMCVAWSVMLTSLGTDLRPPARTP